MDIKERYWDVLIGYQDKICKWLKSQVEMEMGKNCDTLTVFFMKG